MAKKLGVGVTGIGWVSSQHIKAFNTNPHSEVVALHGRDIGRVKASIKRWKINVPSDIAIYTDYKKFLQHPGLDVVAIATPNHLHASQTIKAAEAGKHMLIEKPIAINRKEMAAMCKAVKKAGVRTIVSYELHYNPLFKFGKWLQEAGVLGDLFMVKTQYHSKMGDWYSGWNWASKKFSGASMLLCAGCHAVDAFRYFGGELTELQAYWGHYNRAYEYPDTIVINCKRKNGGLGQISASASVAMPYHFGLELYGKNATLKDHMLMFHPPAMPFAKIAHRNPFRDVKLTLRPYNEEAKYIHVDCILPDSANVEHHPFQGEIDELVECIREDRETHLNLKDAMKTNEICFLADDSAAKGGKVMRVKYPKW